MELELKITRTKVTVHLPEKLWTSFQQRAQAKGVTVTELLRRAIWVYGTLDDKQAEGFTLVIEDPLGEKKAVELLLER